eukprot:3419484-Rhodomonas_salina.2
MSRNLHASILITTCRILSHPRARGPRWQPTSVCGAGSRLDHTRSRSTHGARRHAHATLSLPNVNSNNTHTAASERRASELDHARWTMDDDGRRTSER